MDTCTQIEFFADQEIGDRASLHRFLSEDLGRPLSLSLTKNRVSMLNYCKRADGSISLRLHEKFVEAPKPILLALHRYLRTQRKTDWAKITMYVQTLDPTTHSRKRKLKTLGQVYDLNSIRKRVNAIHFQNNVPCHIGWGTTRAVGQKRRSIRYGSCDIKERIIRIHPLLDQCKVPAAFVDYIVFHEMLHLVIPPRRAGHIWQVHPPEFRHLERRYPGYLEMRQLAHRLLAEL